GRDADDAGAEHDRIGVRHVFDPGQSVPPVYGSRGAKSVSRQGLPAADSPMPWYDPLAWLGRQGTRAVALSLFAGRALPWLRAAWKPLFTPSVFVLLCLAFLRVDPAALRRRLARPSLVLAATAWMMVATPVVCGPVLAGLGLERGLLVALTFQVAA